ncbi:MAG: GGDEF domain-containing protein [Ruminococcus sp.]
MKTDKIISIAVVVAGIDEEYQRNIINGINSYTKEHNINTSYFAAFGGVLASKRYDIGEYRIYDLINFSSFDGTILMTNTINDSNEKNKIIQRVKESGIPAVVFDCAEYPDFYNIKIDNFDAMSDMVRHVINRHDARVINYISGPLANPEARDRYNAFISVMDEYNLPVDSRRVFYGEFRGQDGRQAIEEFIQSGMELPDAFICANDAMALTAVTTLEKHGYKVPDDVIVTGFDYTDDARNFSPALSSVNRPLFDSGYMACRIIDEMAAGKEFDKEISLESSSVFSESCGCMLENSDEISVFKKYMYKTVERCNANILMINRLTASLAEAETSEEDLNVIAGFMKYLECEKCAVCLCTNWYGAFRDSISQISSEDFSDSYTNTMSAPLIWEKGECHDVDFFDLSDMFPEPLEGGGNISYFLPLHFRERCLGYYVITNSEFPIKSRLFHSLVLNISNSIENIRKLLHLNSAISELNKLYVIDPLCNIYNRNGFIRIADDMLRDCVVNSKSVMMCFIDMDGLKYINDNFGHNEGDFAIQRLAGVVNDCCDTRCICARFGGDEFIIFGANKNEKDVSVIERRFNGKIAEINNIIKKPYSVSASFGSYVTVPDKNTTLYSVITVADERMYEIKKQKKNSRSYNASNNP